ncbi:hypothetical protein FO519_008001 [Halicephalobus sp. NKZ332]|nr:hypothetical protein FO519_008001 [Halicephalobus sp. NKZ332]
MSNLNYPGITSSERNDSQSIHIRKVANIVAIISIILYIPACIGAAIMHAWICIPINVLLSLIYVAILLADKFEKPALYLPFLIFNKEASIVAIICIISCAISIIGAVSTHSWVRIPLILLGSLIYVAVLFADKLEKPVLYLPFLILGGIGLILGIVQIVFFTALLIFSPETLQEIISDEDDLNILTPTISPTHPTDDGTFKIIMIIALVILIICELIGLYFWNTVRKARAYMIAEVTSENVRRNYNITGYNGP